MKHPREYTLNEIETLLRLYPDIYADKVVNDIFLFIARCQTKEAAYQVAKVAEEIKTARSRVNRPRRTANDVLAAMRGQDDIDRMECFLISEGL
jgi:hypothetical protein